MNGEIRKPDENEKSKLTHCPFGLENFTLVMTTLT